MNKKQLWRRILNRLLAVAARFGPGATTLRPLLHRWRGVRIEGTVFIGDDVYIENEYPECIELEEGAQICLRTILLAHTHGSGRIIIRKNAFIGANCVIMAAPRQTVIIGEGSVVTASSVVAASVPPGVLYGIARAKPLAYASVPLAMGTPYAEFLSGIRPFLPPKRP